MPFVVWKMINGHGPYAYLRQSVWRDGQSKTVHLGYLGCWAGASGASADGSDAIVPGSVVIAPDGQEVRVPEFSPSILRRLGTSPSEPADGLGTSSPEPADGLGTSPTGPSEGDLGTSPSEPADGLGTSPTGPSEGDLGTSSPEPADGLGTSPTGPSEGDLGTSPSEPADGLGTSPTGPSEGDLGIGEPVPVASAPAPARPLRLPDGSWGVLSREPLAVGDQVRVTTSGGQSWTATVTEVLETTERGAAARTSGRPPRGA